MKHAFTFMELLIVLVIIGIVAAIGLPGLNKARNDAELESIRTRAAQIQSAKLGYVETIGRDNANTAWAASTVAQRFALLLNYLPMNFPDTLATAIPAPFAIDLGNTIDAAVTLTGPRNDGSNGNIPLLKY